jgi:tRNA-splicing ligase RtcB
MRKVITTEKIPIKCWLDDIEDNALVQAQNLANLPFVFKHVALMPDCHAGYGMPIGGVLTTKGVVIPNAVGLDVGCGCCLIQSNLRDISREDLKKVMDRIKRDVPVGFNHQKKEQDISLMPVCSEDHPVVMREFDKARYQLGTLGGGNHFIEIQRGSDGYIWIMIHSGSRNLGKQVADYYNKEAVRLNEMWFSKVEKNVELAFLPMSTDIGKQYFAEMQYCVDFALSNRRLIMENIKKCFMKVFPEIQFDEMVNIAHNYAAYEHHFGENVIVHRKGATYAGKDNIGIIPGSQGTKSYLVRGLGNPESFLSCSHGAGRRMGRKEAQRSLNLEDEIKMMNDKGILHGIKTVNDLDEAAGAYKDIDVVMENQKDLVEIVIEFTPIGVIKG